MERNKKKEEKFKKRKMPREFRPNFTKYLKNKNEENQKKVKSKKRKEKLFLVKIAKKDF